MTKLYRSRIKMATGKIHADINFVNPYLHAKIRTRTRARNPSRVGNNARTRYPWISACPRIPIPVQDEEHLAWARASGAAGTWPGRGQRGNLDAASVGPRRGRRAPPPRGPRLCPRLLGGQGRVRPGSGRAPVPHPRAPNLSGGWSGRGACPCAAPPSPCAGSERWVGGLRRASLCHKGARSCTRRCRAGLQEARAAVATPGRREDVGRRRAGGTTEGDGGAQGLREELVDDDGDGGAKPEQHREEGEGPRRRTGRRRRRRGAAGGGTQEGERRTKTGKGRYAAAHKGEERALG
jgi:hypothetical protein